MVLDSGSSVSLIDHEFYLSLKSCHMILEETQQPTLTLRTANGSAIEVTNEVLVPMTLAPDCNISIRFKVAKHLSMPPRSAMLIDVDHNLPPSLCPSNREAYVTKSTTSDLPQAFHLTPGIATLHDLHNHSTPFIVVNTSFDEPLSLPPKTIVAHLEVLDGTNVTISNFSDARDDVIPQAQHVAPPAPIPSPPPPPLTLPPLCIVRLPICKNLLPLLC